MNFLGHAWLSPPGAEILVGNFTADFVGAKPPAHWTTHCIHGWTLHRAIDQFTDLHPAFKRLKSELFPHVGHYASVLVDLWLDHILAADWEQMNPDTPSLNEFCSYTYKELQSAEGYFPQRFSGVFQRMYRENWLEGYAKPQGMYATLEGLAYRSSGFAPYLEKFNGPQYLVDMLTHSQHPMRKEGRQLLLDAQKNLRPSAIVYTQKT